MIKLFLTFVIFLPFIQCRTGVTIVNGYPDSVFQCFAQNHATYVCAYSYLAEGRVNPTTTQNLKFAKNHGLATDVTMSHCSSKDPIGQVNQMMDAVPSDQYDMIWISIEVNYTPGCSMTTNSPQKNCDYIRAMAGAISSRGKKAGISTSRQYWKQIFQSYTFCYQVSNLPLWYRDYDGNASFQGFLSFGGWTTPNAKTYASQYSTCGTQVNLNWSPYS